MNIYSKIAATKSERAKKTRGLDGGNGAEAVVEAAEEHLHIKDTSSETFLTLSTRPHDASLYTTKHMSSKISSQRHG